MGVPKSMESGPCPKQADFGIAHFLHVWARARHTPAGKEKQGFDGLLYKQMFCLSDDAKVVLMSILPENLRRSARHRDE